MMADINVGIGGCATMVVKYDSHKEDVYGIVLRR